MSIQSLVSLYDASVNGGMAEFKTSEKFCGTYAITHFFAKTKPEHETTMTINCNVFAKTNIYTLDPVTEMYEICFFSKVVNMIDLPDQYAKCFLIRDTAYDMSIQCKDFESIYIKTIPNKPFVNIDKMNTYIEFAMPNLGQRCNILMYAFGLIIPRIAVDKNDSTHSRKGEKQLVRSFKDKIEKYVPDAVVLEEFKTI
jgi:hypothetical protein